MKYPIQLRNRNLILQVVFSLFLLEAGFTRLTVSAGTPFTFENTGSLATGRHDHTGTPLQSGKALAAGASYTAMPFNALDSNTTGSDSALASWIWRPTGSLNTARFSHTATLLQNGMVLVAGGRTGAVSSASAELYDQASGTWTATGSLNTARSAHTATLLQNGMVLVAGGSFDALESAELYDPTSGSWTNLASLFTARYDHTATLLQNGRVLVAGGIDPDNHLPATAEVGRSHR